MSENTLIERLREPYYHDPACPFQEHCYCGEDGTPPPHDKGGDPILAEAADALSQRDARIAELEEGLRGPQAWLERWASHVGTCRGGDQCTCGLTLARYEITALLSPAVEGGAA